MDGMRPLPSAPARCKLTAEMETPEGKTYLVRHSHQRNSLLAGKSVSVERHWYETSVMSEKEATDGGLLRGWTSREGKGEEGEGCRGGEEARTENARKLCCRLDFLFLSLSIPDSYGAGCYYGS